MDKSKTTLSWGVLFVIFGVFALFLFAFTQNTTLKKEPLIAIEGFSFNGSTITDYSGDDEVITIPSSYSIGGTENITGTITFNYEWEAFDFLDENYKNGAAGYYDFYSQIYTQTYPWVYEYSIDKPVCVEGTDIQITSISVEAFQDNRKIKKVILPDSITRIENFAFQNCSALEEVVFGNNVKFIGDSSFWGCGFKSIELPKSLETIYPYAFFYCQQLEEITIPKNVNYMGIGICNGCSALKTATIETTNQISTWGNEVYAPFSNCPSLETIYVPEQNLEFYKTTEPWSFYASKYKKLK